MRWVKQSNMSTKEILPCITIRKMQVALNVALVKASGHKIGDFAEVYVSDCGEFVGVKFFKEDGDGRYKLTPDGGGISRCTDFSAANAILACPSVSKYPSIAPLVGTKSAKLIATLGEGGVWIGTVTPTWMYDTDTRKPLPEDIGVYQYLLDGEPVYIGKGYLQKRFSSVERKEWAYDKIQYMLIDEPKASKQEAKLLAAFKAKEGRLPFYNKVLGMGK